MHHLERWKHALRIPTRSKRHASTQHTNFEENRQDDDTPSNSTQREPVTLTLSAFNGHQKTDEISAPPTRDTRWMHEFARIERRYLPFFRLPGEIRTQIYEEVLINQDIYIDYHPQDKALLAPTAPEDSLRPARPCLFYSQPNPQRGDGCECHPLVEKSNRFNLSILLVSKQVRRECQAMVFENSTFCFDGIVPALNFLGYIRMTPSWMHYLLTLERIRLDIDIFDFDSWSKHIVAGFIMYCQNVKSIHIHHKALQCPEIFPVYHVRYVVIEKLTELFFPLHLLCTVRLEEAKVTFHESFRVTIPDLWPQIEEMGENLQVEMLKQMDVEERIYVTKMAGIGWRDWLKHCGMQ